MGNRFMQAEKRCVTAILGRIDTDELIPGDYSLRLVVVDNVGEALPPCVIQIHVIAQQE